MDEEYEMHRLLGLVHYREKRKTVEEEKNEYKKALEDITKATTVMQMIDIAYRVLAENRKWKN